MKKFVIFDIIVGLALLCVAFGIGLKIGKTHMQNELHDCKLSIELYESDFNIDEVCADKFEKMGC